MNRPHRIKLEEQDFADLIRGKTVQLKAHTGNIIAEVALSDIGWERMYFQLERATRDAGVMEL